MLVGLSYNPNNTFGFLGAGIAIVIYIVVQLFRKHNPIRDARRESTDFISWIFLGFIIGLIIGDFLLKP